MILFGQFPSTVRELCVPHVHMASTSKVFPQTVSGVDGESKTQTHFSLAPGSTSTSSKRSSKMQARHSSDCKNETTLKRRGKKQGHLQSERSGVYAKEKVSVHHSAAVATEHSSPPTGTFHPSTQVNHCFV